MIAVTVRREKEGDADLVLASLSQQSHDELAAASLRPEYLARKARDRGDLTFVAEQNGVPLLLFGFDEKPDRLWLWTLSTETYFDGGAPMVRATRRFFRKLATVKPICAATAAPHRDTDRWLRLLGFKKVDQSGVFRVFEKS